MTEKERRDLEDQLRAAISASELAPAEIARRGGVSRSYLSRFIAGERSISLAYAHRIAEALGLTLVIRKKR
jgi:transcriptional regulator with XRE-family HTH domain